jgi:hypothetical protein
MKMNKKAIKKYYRRMLVDAVNTKNDMLKNHAKSMLKLAIRQNNADEWVNKESTVLFPNWF